MKDKVLIVDDDPNILKAYSRFLKKDFNIETALNGQLALKAFKKNSPFSVVICDMQMPEINGLEVLSEIRANYPDTSRIMITGNNDQETAKRAINTGNIFQFLTKPCDNHEIKKAIDEGIKYYKERVNLKTSLSEKQRLEKELKTNPLFKEKLKVKQQELDREKRNKFSILEKLKLKEAIKNKEFDDLSKNLEKAKNILKKNKIDFDLESSFNLDRETNLSDNTGLSKETDLKQIEELKCREKELTANLDQRSLENEKLKKEVFKINKLLEEKQTIFEKAKGFAKLIDKEKSEKEKLQSNIKALKKEIDMVRLQLKADHGTNLRLSENEKRNDLKHEAGSIEIDNDAPLPAQKLNKSETNQEVNLNNLNSKLINLELISKEKEELIASLENAIGGGDTLKTKIKGLANSIKETQDKLKELRVGDESTKEYFLELQKILKKKKKLKLDFEKNTSSESLKQVPIIRKIKKTEDEHHGSSAWKIAYADFVTAMMAFFLVMWLISQLSQEAKESLVEYFHKNSLHKLTGIGENLKQDFSKGKTPKENQNQVQKLFQDEISIAKLRGDLVREYRERFPGLEEHFLVKSHAGGVRIEIMDKDNDPMFKIGQAELTSKAEDLLGWLAKRIKSLPNRIIIEGHTDGLPYANGKGSNLDLSVKRASSARLFLEKNGVKTHRFFRIIGYGPFEPFIKKDIFSAKNRRIKIILLPDSKEEFFPKMGEKKPIKTLPNSINEG
jgi:chemotaxis protein MotB